MVELKPCPFYGYKHITIARIEYTCPEDSVWFVLCHGCGARSGDAIENKEQAVKLWNRRADNG